VAREHGGPLEQNPGLAEALSTPELDQEIPEQLYRAVAQILGVHLTHERVFALTFKRQSQ